MLEEVVSKCCCQQRYSQDAHASREGMYMMEVDRVLRLGGYWVLSDPPINWKTYYQTWKRSNEELQEEQEEIEKMAELLCWENKYEKGDIAVWGKKKNAELCRRRQDDLSTNFCESTLADEVRRVVEVQRRNRVQEFMCSLFLVQAEDGMNNTGYMVGHRVGESGLSDSRASNQHIAYGFLQGIQPLASTF